MNVVDFPDGLASLHGLTPLELAAARALMRQGTPITRQAIEAVIVRAAEIAEESAHANC